MSLLRGARQPVSRTLAQPASFRLPASSSLQQRSYADQKTANGAKPKILNENPPDESSASQDVKEHNKEVDRRVDRPQEKVKEEDVEKDKVPKGFWQGSQAGNHKESS